VVYLIGPFKDSKMEEFGKLVHAQYRYNMDVTSTREQLSIM